jgi:hypothetical protein
MTKEGRKPKYKAFKPITVTDGILTFTKLTFDNTVPWTPDDCERFKTMLDAAAPRARIKAMQAKLESVTDTNPAIQMMADEIRAIHANVKSHHSLTREDLDELGRTEQLWQRILIVRDVIPLARTGGKVKKGASLGHEAVHGSEAKKNDRWAKYKRDCLSVAREHPNWGLESIRKEVAEMNGVSLKTISRYTSDLSDLLRNAK